MQPNPFKPMLFISHHVPTSSPDDPRYAKGWLDLLFIAYHIIVFSFIRQFTLFEIIFPIARKLGIKKQAKLDRFGEQAYAVLYYGTMGFWGAVSYFYNPFNSTKALIRTSWQYIMSSLPTWWYRTEHYWIGAQPCTVLHSFIFQLTYS